MLKCDFNKLSTVNFRYIFGTPFPKNGWVLLIFAAQCFFTD